MQQLNLYQILNQGPVTEGRQSQCRMTNRYIARSFAHHFRWMHFILNCIFVCTNITASGHGIPHIFTDDQQICTDIYKYVQVQSAI